MKVKINIKRFDGQKEFIETFEEEINDRTTVLDILEKIKYYQDPTLTFREQCRAAICGTCGVKLNENNVLACKTKVKDYLDENDSVTIEPKNNLPVIKDLVVDHSVFLEKLKNVKAWFVPKENWETVYPEDLKKFDKETDCILCGLCYSACPAFEADPQFGGPINYVKVYRFWKDKNDALGDERIVLAKEDHITSCVHCKYCTMVCPKVIPVEQDITQIEFYGKQKGIIEKQEDTGFGFGFDSGFGF